VKVKHINYKDEYVHLKHRFERLSDECTSIFKAKNEMEADLTHALEKKEDHIAHLEAEIAGLKRIRENVGLSPIPSYAPIGEHKIDWDLAKSISLGASGEVSQNWVKEKFGGDPLFFAEDGLEDYDGNKVDERISLDQPKPKSKIRPDFDYAGDY
jgi:hypothetical protein